MPRRKESIFDLFILLPWWVSLGLGALACIGLIYVLPGFNGVGPITGTLVQKAPTYAQFVGFIFIALAITSAVRSWSIGRNLESQLDLETLAGLSWKEFENLVGEMYRRQGYMVREQLSGGADGGIDLKLSKGGEYTVVQCKRWTRRKVQVQIVRELYGVMVSEGADAAVLITTSSFTSGAREFAREKPITLIEGSALLCLLKGVQKSGRIQRLDSDPMSAAPACPRCGEVMISRTARRGTNAGESFWGCRRYPDCRGTRAG